MVSGQETQVKVLKGKVKAQTDTAVVMVAAGQKGVLSQDKSPVVAVDDPMVDDLIKMYPWIEEEKKAGKIKIDYSAITISSVESEQILAGAHLAEMPNNKSVQNDICRIGVTSILQGVKYYDLEGNLLTYELDKVSKDKGIYYINYGRAIAPGEKFKLISVGKFAVPPNIFWKDGKVWHVRMGNCTPNCLNYFRVILPKSAIFVGSSRPIMLADSVDGRTAVTIRNYTGEKADGMYQVSFLWPEKDGTSLKDLPREYRGLGDRENLYKSISKKRVPKQGEKSELDKLP
jgi:hypothetical protein